MTSPTGRSQPAPLTTDGRWIGSNGDAAFGWLSRPAAAASQSGVLILPAVGYAWWSSYQTLRALALHIAATGHQVLRLHYHGTGNAAGSQWEGSRLSAWQASIRLGALELRAAGCESLSLVGVGLGATLALQLAAELDVAAVAAWRPVINGRREARGLKLRSISVPDTDSAIGTISFAGTIFDAELLAAIAATDLLTTPHWPQRVLLIDSPDHRALADHLEAIDVLVEHTETNDGDQALSVAAEDAVIATGVLDAVTSWLGPADVVAEHAGSPRQPTPSSTDFHWEGAQVHERITQTGPHQLIGIETTPTTGPTQPGTIVLLNSGSEPHNGAGNVWTELARHLAVHGHRVLRIDWRGWGESPDDGYAPGRPYDPHTITETIEIIDALEQRGDGPITLIGLCAGAWIALKAILQKPTAGVIALNPQFYWQPGELIIGLTDELRAWREPIRQQEEAGRLSGKWDALDRAGERDHAGQWLDQLAASPTHVTLLFARGDVGVEHLHNRLAARISEHRTSGDLALEEIDDIDHPMHRAWLRPIVFAAIRRALEASEAAATRSRAHR